MEYGRAWNLIYATFLHFRIFGVLTRTFDTGTEHQILTPSEKSPKKKVTDSIILEIFSHCQ
jgi:hypothetical protein